MEIAGGSADRGFEGVPAAGKRKGWRRELAVALALWAALWGALVGGSLAVGELTRVAARVASCAACAEISSSLGIPR